MLGDVEDFFTERQGSIESRETNLSEEHDDDQTQQDIDLEEVVLDEKTSEPEEEPVEAIFESGRGYVSHENTDKISQQGFYGTRLDDGRLELLPVEILHLIERKRIFVKSVQGGKVEAKEIINDLLPDDPDLWVRYLVFRDLRSRGYAVRQGLGHGIGFRVYARGEKPGNSTANQFVYILKEGVPISLTNLDMITDAASAARKKLVFALVDRNGEVNYYKVAQTTLRNRGDDS